MLTTLIATGMSGSGTVTGRTGDLPGTEPGGSGTNLPRAVLIVATASSALATVLSLLTIWLQLKNYRKIALQRLVVRILVMVPIYSLSSLISLYSLDLAFFLDAVRDVYEAFVIYCFFNLLVEYLGGERSLIILLHGRPPIRHPFPLSSILPPLDVSDPFTFLAIKRGILQYVQIKPFLAAATILLKALGSYGDGNLSKSSGYTYISIIYNLSVGLSLYCLALFWIATNADLKPYRPMPKFLCVKGIIFFSFWQGFAVSVLVKLGWLRSHRYETEALSLAIQDTLVCLEMPLFAFLHLYAFSYTDYIDAHHLFSGRLPIYYALRDAFGYKDIFTDSITTVKGTGFSYRTFEPVEGGLHQGLGRDRRVAAGLRYAQKGRIKYWVELAGEESDAYGRKGKTALVGRPLHAFRNALEHKFEAGQGYAPLGQEEARKVVGGDDRRRNWVRSREFGYEEEEEEEEDWKRWFASRGTEGGDDGEVQDGEGDGGGDEESLGFGEVGEEEEDEDERLYKDAKGLEFGDWSYPVVDASKEEARRRMRVQEEARLEAGQFVSFGREGEGRRKTRGKGKGKGKEHLGRGSRGFSYGGLVEPETETSTDAEVDQRSSSSRKRRESSRHRREPPNSTDHPKPEGELLIHGAKHVLHAVSGGLYHSPHDEDGGEGSQSKKSSSTVPRPDRIASGAYDLVVADHEAEEEAQIKDRRKGEPGAAKRRVYRQIYQPDDDGEGEGSREPALSIQPLGNEVVEISREEGEGDGDSGDGTMIVVKEQVVTAVETDGPEGVPGSPPSLP